MTFIRQYLKDHLNLNIMQLLFVCIFGVVFYLYHLPLVAILYPTFICLIVGLLFTGVSIHKAYQKYQKLQGMQYLSEETIQQLLAENIKIEDRIYQELILKLCQEKQLLADKMTGDYKEMMDYFTIWVHQIKTPIASMRLHLGMQDSQLSRRLASDLLHIEQYVEMVLTYLRMGSDSHDYKFHTINLDKLLRENIRKLRGDFIIKKLDLVYEPFDENIVSDEKWLSFVIEQILSNALKYTHQGAVKIYLEAPKMLCISDEGIGIAPEDLPRIFEKGYTGSNGRMDKRASGIGLYLCKQICNRLGHDLVVISKPESGTTVKIDLSQHHYSLS